MQPGLGSERCLLKRPGNAVVRNVRLNADLGRLEPLKSASTLVSNKAFIQLVKLHCDYDGDLPRRSIDKAR